MHREGEAPEFLAAILRLDGVSVPGPATAAEVDRLEESIGARLPGPHRALLVRGNGVVASWGYDRLLGVGNAATHIGPWNANRTWKFAWAMPLDDYLCVAETGFGDQYAYRLTELRRGIEAVHRLDRHLMEPAEELAAADFERFLRAFFSRAQEPDETVLSARRQVGDLAADEHAFAPPALPAVTGGAPKLTKMPASEAMIMQGDLATQLLDPANERRQIAALERYQDPLGRPRLKVVWE
jgi:hypothetical protein